jgi:hypothetical protein
MKDKIKFDMDETIHSLRESKYISDKAGTFTPNVAVRPGKA